MAGDNSDWPVCKGLNLSVSDLERVHSSNILERNFRS